MSGHSSSYRYRLSDTPLAWLLFHAIQLPKISPIRANIHREIIGKVSSITLTLSPTGKYYAFILSDDGLEASIKLTSVTAYDIGLKDYLIRDDGKTTANPRFLVKAYRRLARHIGDAAWSKFVEKLAYKAESAGVHLVKLEQ